MDPAVSFIKNLIEESSESSSDTDDTACASSVVKEEKREVLRSNAFMDITYPNYSAREFQENFRLTRHAFDFLHGKLEKHLKNYSYGPDTLQTDKQLLATIWILSTPDSYISIAGRFDMAKSTLHKCFERVINAIISNLSGEIINWPSPEEREIIKRDFKKWGNVPGVTGAIDGTYVPIKAPKDHPETYINRKCFHGITLQGVCDNKRRFIDVFAGYPSSVSDIRIFKNSDLYKQIMSNTGNFFQDGEFIIGDKAYLVSKWCIPPYIDRGNLTYRETNFNKQHARTRQVIERTFALLFGRFRRLKYLDMSKTNFIPQVILASCILHNICLMFSDGILEIYTAEGAANIIQEDENINYDSGPLQREGIQFRDRIANSLLINNPQ